MENEELPTLNNQLDLMASLDEKARHQIAELEKKLEDARHTVDALSKQLDEAEKREMENSLLVAGESRSATEEIQRLRFELDSHKLGKSENEKSVSELESEKMILEQRVARVEDEKRDAVERVSALEKSLKDVTETKDALEEELGIIRETLDREAQDNEDAQTEYRYFFYACGSLFFILVHSDYNRIHLNPLGHNKFNRIDVIENSKSATLFTYQHLIISPSCYLFIHLHKTANQETSHCM